MNRKTGEEIFDCFIRHKQSCIRLISITSATFPNGGQIISGNRDDYLGFCGILKFSTLSWLYFGKSATRGITAQCVLSCLRCVGVALGFVFHKIVLASFETVAEGEEINYQNA